MTVQEEIIVQHLGRKSTVSIFAGRDEVDAFIGSLMRDQFFIESRSESDKKGRWVLSRRVRLMAGDWPMQVLIEQNGKNITISYFMFMPWGWIVTLAIMLFFFLPFVPVSGTHLVFLLGLGVVAVAIYKQRFDFSPNASWQGPPRQRWNDKMMRLLTDAFLHTAQN